MNMGTMFTLGVSLLLWAGAAHASKNSCEDGKRCDYRYPSTGICQMWLSYTECGPVCVSGRVCDSEYSATGLCADYRTDALCGDRCTKTEVCRSRYSDGRCAETEYQLSCSDN